MTRRQTLPLIITLLMVIIIGATITLTYAPEGKALHFWARAGRDKRGRVAGA